MGMYTEFYFRANIKDGAVADWLERQIEGDEWFEDGGLDEHPFFTLTRWDSVFRGGGAVYQESRVAIFRRKKTGGGEPYHNQLVLASSLKDYGDEIAQFIDWITPHLEMCVGEFLGYSLYEDSYETRIGWDRESPGSHREHPTLYFNGSDEVQA